MSDRKPSRVSDPAQQRRLLADRGGTRTSTRSASRTAPPTPIWCAARSRTIMIDVGLSSNFAQLLAMPRIISAARRTSIDMVILSHEHLDHIGAAWHFGGRTLIAAHRLAANKIMLRDDFSMLRKMFNEPDVPINVDHLAGRRQSDRPRQFPAAA